MRCTLRRIFIPLTSRKGTLDVLEDTKEDVSDEEMILLLSSTIEKLQQVEDDYFYSLDLREYLNNIKEDDDEN